MVFLNGSSFNDVMLGVFNLFDIYISIYYTPVPVPTRRIICFESMANEKCTSSLNWKHLNCWGERYSN